MRNIIIFGNQQIALNCTEILRNSYDINILAVVGCESDHDKTMGYPSLEDYCRKKSLFYLNWDKLENSIIRLTKNKNVDFCFSFYYRKIFTKDQLSIANQGFINIHPSLLPKYRGPVPSMWALLNGETLTGTTIHYIDNSVDAGDIIAQKKISIGNSISGFELHNKLIDEGSKLFKSNLQLILKGTNTKKPQNHSFASYFGPFNNSIRYINWYDPKITIYNKVRTFKKPYAGAIAKIGNKEIIFWSAKITSSQRKLLGPGRIVEIYKDGSFVVSAVDGFLHILEYGFENKNKNFKKYISINNTFSF